MKIASEPTALQLSSREPLSLDFGDEVEMTVTRGWVWVTRDGDDRDLVLGAGRLARRRLVP